jgi:hypothetical protein
MRSGEKERDAMWIVVMHPGEPLLGAEAMEAKAYVRLEYEDREGPEEIRFNSLGDCIVTTSRDLSPAGVVRFAKLWREAAYDLMRGNGTTYSAAVEKAFQAAQ